MTAKLYIEWGGQYDVRNYDYDETEHEWYNHDSGSRIVKVGKKDPTKVIAAYGKKKLQGLKTTGYMTVDGTKVVDKLANPAPKGKWLPVKAIKFNKNGSVSLKK